MTLQCNADSHFVIGKLHVKQNKPCQDHALSDQVGESSLIVVSDGCSSGRYTDIGSRIVTCATITAHKEYVEAGQPNVRLMPESIHAMVVRNLETSKRALCLKNDDLLATCVYAVVMPEGGFIHILGDGHALIKYTDGSRMVYNVSWQNNMPYYPGEVKNRLFIELHSQIDKGMKSVRQEIVTVSPKGEPKIEWKNIPINEAVRGIVIPLSKETIARLQCVAVASDGIASFKDEMIIDPVETLSAFTSFKTWEGEFVKRRLTQGLKDYAKDNIVPDDDVSLAAIHVTHKTDSHE